MASPSAKLCQAKEIAICTHNESPKLQPFNKDKKQREWNTLQTCGQGVGLLNLKAKIWNPCWLAQGDCFGELQKEFGNKQKTWVNMGELIITNYYSFFFPPKICELNWIPAAWMWLFPIKGFCLP